MRIRRIALALALVGLTAGLTACGVSNSVDPVAAAATKTQDAGGVSVNMSLRFMVPSGDKLYEITAEGAFDKDKGQMTMDLSDVFQLSGAAPGTGAGVKFIYLKEDGDPVLYMNLPFLATHMPGGRIWIRLDLQKAGKSFGVDFNQLLNQSNQNPAQALDMLRASGQIEKVGSDVVNGVATTEYKGTIDLTKAAELHGVSQDMVQRLIAAGGPSEIPVEVWIGDDGLVRQLRMTEDLSAGGRSLSMVMTIGLSDFGTDVSVTAPPADKVFDATALAGKG